MVISGKDKGKKAKILVALQRRKVIVEGVNINKHKNPQGNYNKRHNKSESPIFAPKLCFGVIDVKGVRVGKRTLQDGSKVRYCKSCEEILDK